MKNVPRGSQIHARRRPEVEPLEGRPLLSGTAMDFTHQTPAVHFKGEVPPTYLHAPIPAGMPLTEHIHPHLTIIIKGHARTIPANIGHVPYVGWLPIHTHTPDGTIHIESTVAYTFRLKDFFDVWGKTLNPHDVLGYSTNPRHRLTMSVDGRPSRAFGNLVLKDHQQIVITYT